MSFLARLGMIIFIIFASVSLVSKGEASMFTHIYNSGDDLVIDQYGTLDISNAGYEKAGRFRDTYMRADSFNTQNFLEVQSHVGGYDWAYFNFYIASEADLDFAEGLSGALGPTHGGTVLGNGGIGYFLNNGNSVEGWKAHTFYLPSTYDGGELRVQGVAEGRAVAGLQSSSRTIDLGSDTLEIFIGTQPSNFPDISTFNSNEYANMPAIPIPAGIFLLLSAVGIVGALKAFR